MAGLHHRSAFRATAEGGKTVPLSPHRGGFPGAHSDSEAARARSTAAGAVASLVASIASTATWVEDRTALEDEDVVVALWLAVVLGAILLLTVALVGLS